MTRRILGRSEAHYKKLSEKFCDKSEMLFLFCRQMAEKLSGHELCVVKFWGLSVESDFWRSFARMARELLIPSA
jgi:hypothetical protein